MSSLKWEGGGDLADGSLDRLGKRWRRQVQRPGRKGQAGWTSISSASRKRRLSLVLMLSSLSPHTRPNAASDTSAASVSSSLTDVLCFSASSPFSIDPCSGMFILYSQMIFTCCSIKRRGDACTDVWHSLDLHARFHPVNVWAAGYSLLYSTHLRKWTRALK